MWCFAFAPPNVDSGSGQRAALKRDGTMSKRDGTSGGGGQIRRKLPAVAWLIAITLMFLGIQLEEIWPFVVGFVVMCLAVGLSFVVRSSQ